MELNDAMPGFAPEAALRCAAAIRRQFGRKAHMPGACLKWRNLFPTFPLAKSTRDHQDGAVTPDIMHSRNASRGPRSTIPPASTNTVGLRRCARR